jgi:dTMP kinase
LFLSLDGIDGTGKSTQCRLLVNWLRGQGHKVVSCVDPGGTPLGQELRHIVLSHKHAIADSCEALLFMASRAQLVAEVIRPALAAGQVVVSDRFLLATIAYQGYGRKLDVDQLWQVGELATGGLQPDRTFVFDLPVELARTRRHRRAADRMESEPTDYHERVRQGFLAEASRQPGRIIVLDASPTIDEVQALLRQRVQEVLPREH